MTPTKVPSLNEVADNPQLVRTLPRPLLLELAVQAHTVHGILMTAVLASASADAPAAGEDRLLTAAELAQRMGVSKNFVYDHCDEWPFTIRRPNTRAMFSLRGFGAWVASQDGRAVSSPRASARKGA